MNKIVSLTLALALMAALFTGCGCEANVSTHPNGMITEETTRPTVMPTPTATHATEPSESRNTMPTVTGSDPTGESSMPDGGNGGNGGGNSGSGNSGGGNGSSGSSGGTGSNGTNGGTGSNESSTPTDSTMEQRGRNRNTAR